MEVGSHNAMHLIQNRAGNWRSRLLDLVYDLSPSIVLAGVPQAGLICNHERRIHQVFTEEPDLQFIRA